MPWFEPLAGGFRPRCWTDGRQVLKIWDDGLPASLSVLVELDLPVVAPMATASVAGCGAAVFPFVCGRPAIGTDAPALARTMRRMHDHPLVELPRVPLEESWCLQTMRDRLDHPWIRDRRAEVEAQLDRLEGAVRTGASNAPAGRHLPYRLRGPQRAGGRQHRRGRGHP